MNVVEMLVMAAARELWLADDRNRRLRMDVPVLFALARVVAHGR